MLYCFNIHRNTVKAFNKVLHDQLFMKTAMVEILRIAVFPSGIDSVGHVLFLKNIQFYIQILKSYRSFD